MIYVFCSNDIRNLYENNLVRLDAEGNLIDPEEGAKGGDETAPATRG